MKMKVHYNDPSAVLQNLAEFEGIEYPLVEDESLTSCLETRTRLEPLRSVIRLGTFVPLPVRLLLEHCVLQKIRRAPENTAETRLDFTSCFLMFEEWHEVTSLVIERA